MTRTLAHTRVYACTCMCIYVARYAVRGTVAVRAGELKGALARGDTLPFDKLTLCNIGNPHAVQQKPITYYRQVLAPPQCPCATPTPLRNRVPP